MKLVMKVAATTALALATLTAGTASAQTYTNAPGDNISAFGAAGDTPIYGQVFTAPTGSLSSWTFYNNANNTAGETFGIAAWNGTTVVGSNLFTAATNVVSPDAAAAGFFAHTVSSINLNLTAGASYFAYFTVNGVVSPVSAITFEGSDTSPLGGGFRYSSANAPAAGNSFQSFSVPNLRYTAVFTPSIAAAAPEPAMWGMMILGFGIVGFAMRRRQKVDVRVSYAA